MVIWIVFTAVDSDADIFPHHKPHPVTRMRTNSRGSLREAATQGVAPAISRARSNLLTENHTLDSKCFRVTKEKPPDVRAAFLLNAGHGISCFPPSRLLG
jgi:hypothetical protein